MDYDTIENDKRVTLYSGDYKEGHADSIILKDNEKIKNILGNTFTIAEFKQMSYEELLQRSFQFAYERNPNYFEEDRVTTFLYWYDDFLIDIGSFDWTYNDKMEKSLFLSHFFYTKMTKYKDVLNEKVFDKPTKICVVRTSRPIIKKIVDYIKKIDA